MPSTSAPFGMRPSFHPSGLDRAVALPGGIPSGYSTNLLKGQPVALNTSGVIIAATAGSAFQGAFAGVEFTDTTGRRRVSNYWPASTTGTDITSKLYKHFSWFNDHWFVSLHDFHIIGWIECSR